MTSHNTYHSLSDGMFGSKLTKYDIYNKNFGEFEFNYHAGFRGYNHGMTNETNFGPMVSESAIDDTGKSISELISEGFENKLVNDIYRKIKLNEYKRRQAPPGLRVSSKAFGIGRRVPIVNNFNG